MPSQTDVREVEGTKEKKKRRFDKRDWGYISEYICDEFSSRKTRRGDQEKIWEDIDRQISMTPELSHKKLPNGAPDKSKLWMSEMELPLQAQALEVLTADARRLMFPDSGPWFRAHAALTDQYLSRVDFQSLVTGDENEVPSRINQDNANRLVEGFLSHLFDQYDFCGNIDRLNAEAFKYGVAVGRARMVKKNILIDTSRGVMKDTVNVPVLLPRSIKRTYLDDNPNQSMNEGLMVGPSVIDCCTVKLEDLVMSANRGSPDPDKETGGWMPANLKGMEGDKNGFVEVLEYEGDLVVPRKTTSSFFIPGAIVTVVKGKRNNKGHSSVVRFRFRKTPYSSYLLFPYHPEGVDSPYAASPLMKGRPVQISATNALNRWLDAAALKNAPPIGYDDSNPKLNATGGPMIHPHATWPTQDDIQVHSDIGDPSEMRAAYADFVRQYSDVTGINAPRLGAQTVSHTTAYAKDAELQRGVVRTVDYVKSSGKGPMTKWLHMAYDMARRDMKEMTLFLEAYRGWVTIKKEHLPELSTFEWFGAAGPSDQFQEQQRKLQSAQLALQMDQINVQLGGNPIMDLPAMIQQTLSQGGWTDLDAITRLEAVSGGSENEPLVAQVAQGNPSAQTVALQALAQGIPGGSGG